MHSHQRIIRCLQVALHERNVHGAIDQVVVAVHREAAVRRIDRLLEYPFDVALFLEPVTNQVGDRTDANTALARKALEVRPARHAAVFVQDLDDHGGRFEPGKPREIAAGFGMPGTRQDAARLRHDGENMTRLAEVVGAGVRRDRRPDRAGAIVRGYAGRYSFGRLDRDCEIGRVVFIGLRHHQWQPQLRATFSRQRQADQPAAVRRHAIDVFGPHQLRRHDQVTFVLPVFIVDHDDHLARTDIRDDVFDIAERCLDGAGVRCRVVRHNHAL